MLFLPTLWYRALRQFDLAVAAGTTGGLPHVTCPKYTANASPRFDPGSQFFLGVAHAAAGVRQIAVEPCGVAGPVIQIMQDNSRE